MTENARLVGPVEFELEAPGRERSGSPQPKSRVQRGTSRHHSSTLDWWAR